jgi:hypothetical protein
MGRSAVVVGMLMLLAACGGGGWMATRPSLAGFLVPDATDIHVVALGWNEWQLSYHAPGTPARWPTVIGRRLESEHWSRTDSVGYGALSRSYTRASPLGFCTLWEWAYLSFDPLRPRVAQIRVRRWITIEWLQHGARMAITSAT